MGDNAPEHQKWLPVTTHQKYEYMIKAIGFNNISALFPFCKAPPDAEQRSTSGGGDWGGGGGWGTAAE